MNPLFSVITPVFNRESLIKEALDSVLDQTYRPIQLIIIDDGSVDKTAEVVKKWKTQLSKSDEIIVDYIFQENAGPSAARNRGIKEVKGKYVQFFDSDDRMHTNRLSILAEIFKTTNADFIQTGFEGFDPESNEVIQTNYGKPEYDQFELALIGRFWANTLRAALHVDLVEKIDPWNIEMTCFEDREYMERALAYSEKAVAIREVLASARRGGSERISDRLKTYEGRSFRIFCEERLAAYIHLKNPVNKNILKVFASRVLSLGLRSSANGWQDLGERCLILSDSIKAKLSIKNRFKRELLRYGKVFPSFQAFLIKRVFKLPK